MTIDFRAEVDKRKDALMEGKCKNRKCEENSGV